MHVHCSQLQLPLLSVFTRYLSFRHDIHKYLVKNQVISPGFVEILKIRQMTESRTSNCESGSSATLLGSGSE